jgi:hypothetical protein
MERLAAPGGIGVRICGGGNRMEDDGTADASTSSPVRCEGSLRRGCRRLLADRIVPTGYPTGSGSGSADAVASARAAAATRLRPRL